MKKKPQSARPRYQEDRAAEESFDDTMNLKSDQINHSKCSSSSKSVTNPVRASKNTESFKSSDSENVGSIYFTLDKNKNASSKKTPTKDSAQFKFGKRVKPDSCPNEKSSFCNNYRPLGPEMLSQVRESIASQSANLLNSMEINPIDSQELCLSQQARQVNLRINTTGKNPTIDSYSDLSENPTKENDSGSNSPKITKTSKSLYATHNVYNRKQPQITVNIDDLPTF